MLYPLHRVILDNSQVFGGVPCKAQLCNFSKWFLSPRFGVVPIWELWQFCYVRIEPPKCRVYTVQYINVALVYGIQIPAWIDCTVYTPPYMNVALVYGRSSSVLIHCRV